MMVKRLVVIAPVVVLAACGGGGSVSDGDSGSASASNGARVMALAAASATSGAVVNGSFEGPALPAGTFVYRPANVEGWTFEGSAALTSTGSGFSLKTPDSGAGVQMVALQNLGKVSQTITVQPGDELWFRAIQRQNYRTQDSGFRVTLGGTYKYQGFATSASYLGFSPTSMTPSAEGWNLYRVQLDSSVAAPQVLTLEGMTSGTGVDATVLLDDVRIVNVASTTSLVDVPNGSFEVPALPAGAHAYRPAGAGWSFNGGAAVARNDSAFIKNGQGAQATLTGYGAQFAVLQSNASMSRTLALQPGDSLEFSYTLRESNYWEVQSYGVYPLRFSVFVNGQRQATQSALMISVGEQDDFGRWVTQTVPLTTVLAAGDYTVELRSEESSPYPDLSFFVDNVKIRRLQIN